MTEVQLEKSIQLFFYEKLEDALELGRVNVSEHARAYVVHVLDKSIRAEDTFYKHIDDNGYLSGTGIVLTDLQKITLESENTQERWKLAVQGGDLTLFLSGICPEKHNEHLGMRFAQGMGSSFYKIASGIRPSEIHEEMAHVFTDVSNALQTVVLGNVQPIERIEILTARFEANPNQYLENALQRARSEIQ